MYFEVLGSVLKNFNLDPRSHLFSFSISEVLNQRFEPQKEFINRLKFRIALRASILLRSKNLIATNLLRILFKISDMKYNTLKYEASQNFEMLKEMSQNFEMLKEMSKLRYKKCSQSNYIIEE
jgi:hypothetical protein